VEYAPEAYRRRERHTPLVHGPPREWWEQHYPATDDGFEALLREGASFGVTRSTLDELRRVAKPGDVLWTYTSSDSSWRALAGRAGVIIVRDGAVVRNVVGVLN
jgi:hypothetical protein